MIQQCQSILELADDTIITLNKAFRVFLAHLFPRNPALISSDWLISQYAKLIQTGPFGSQLHASDYVASGVKVVMPRDLKRSTEINFSTASSISPQKADKLSRHRLKNGDIIFSHRGDIGLIGHYGAKDPAAICGTGCILFRPDSRIEVDYLKALICAPTSQKWLKDNSVGMTMPNLNTKIVSSIPAKKTNSKQIKKISDAYKTLNRALLIAQIKHEKSKCVKQELLNSFFK